MEKDPKTKRKLKKRYKLLIFIIILITFLLLWSRYVSTSGLIVREYKVINSNLPDNFHGLKIVHFSDVHYGRTVKEKELKNIISHINLLKPDLVVFTGDLIDKDIELSKQDTKIIINLLNEIESLYGKYAISGNHDLYFEEYNEILEKSNFVNLNNTYDVIYNEYYETLFIGGLESEIKGSPNIEGVMKYFDVEDFTDEHDDENITEETTNSEENPFKLLIIHTPDTIEQIIDYNFDLILAGHSHNGQIRLPFFGSITNPLGAKIYNEPYYRINNTDIYISGGIGTSVINFRFFNKPSINLYRITKK